MRLLLSVITLLSWLQAISQQPTDENLIHNGDFESGKNFFYSDYTYQESSVNPGEFSIVTDASSLNPYFKPAVKDNDSHFLVVDADLDDNKKFWCTKVRISAAGDYKFTTEASNININLLRSPEIALYVNNIETGTSHLIKDSIWNKYSWMLQLPVSDSLEVCLANVNNTTDGSDLAIDNLQLIQVRKDCPFPADTIKGLVHFPFNESSLTNYSQSKLEYLLQFLLNCPETQVKIFTHTDPLGETDYNHNLAQSRAQTLKTFLVNKGIAPERITTEVYGEKKPIYNGTSFRKQVLNRRADFLISTHR